MYVFMRIIKFFYTFRWIICTRVLAFCNSVQILHCICVFYRFHLMSSNQVICERKETNVVHFRHIFMLKVCKNNTFFYLFHTYICNTSSIQLYNSGCYVSYVKKKIEYRSYPIVWLYAHKFKCIALKQETETLILIQLELLPMRKKNQQQNKLVKQMIRCICLYNKCDRDDNTFE